MIEDRHRVALDWALDGHAGTIDGVYARIDGGVAHARCAGMVGAALERGLPLQRDGFAYSVGNGAGHSGGRGFGPGSGDGSGGGDGDGYGDGNGHGNGHGHGDGDGDAAGYGYGNGCGVGGGSIV